MFGFLAPVWRAFDPLWALIATRTWMCVVVLAVLSAVFLAVGLPLASALTAAALALIFMWKSEHELRSAAYSDGSAVSRI